MKRFVLYAVQRLCNKGIKMAKYYRFDSGLTLLYEKNKINKSTDIDISFDCGTRCDGKLPGLSHFCEHMFFTGTDKLSKQEVNKRYFNFIKVNAFTGYTDILFTGSIMTNRLAEYLNVVQDMVCNSTFLPEAVEEEKKVVIQEIVRDVDKHSHHANRFSDYELFGKDYYKNGILGTKESISQIKSKDVKNYVKKYFVKNNCIIYICTPLKFSKAKSIVKKHFNDKMPSNNLKPLPYKQDRLLDDEKICLYNQNIDKNLFSITFKFNNDRHDLKYRCLLGSICNMIDDISEGLTKELRVDNSLIYTMQSNYFINFVNSFFQLSTEMCSENIKPCLDVILSYINRLKANGFSKEQFDKYLKNNDYYWQTKVNTPNDIKNNLHTYRFYGRYVSPNEVYKQLQNLTLEEVNLTIKELLTNAKIQVFVYGNATKKDIYTLKQIKNKLR